MTFKGRRTWLFTSLLAVISIAIGFLSFFQEIGGEFHWSAFGVFSAAFGFIGCVVIVLIAKGLGRLWLQRNEDYYDE